MVHSDTIVRDHKLCRNFSQQDLIFQELFLRTWKLLLMSPDITFVTEQEMSLKTDGWNELQETVQYFNLTEAGLRSRLHLVSCSTEEHAVMESEGTSSRHWHLSHPLTSLNEKWMGALRKLARHSLTSMFPAMCVHVWWKKTCVCMCVWVSASAVISIDL